MVVIFDQVCADRLGQLLWEGGTTISRYTCVIILFLFTTNYYAPPRVVLAVKSYTPHTISYLLVMHDKGKEGMWIKQLLNEYRKWGLQLYPRLAFEDLVVTVGKLSSKGRLRTFIAELREEERMRYLAEEYGDDIANVSEVVVSFMSW